MSFSRLNDLRSSYHGFERRRGRSLFHKSKPCPESPLLYHSLSNSFGQQHGHGCGTVGAKSVPSSVASSRDSSMDRSSRSGSLRFLDIVDKIWHRNLSGTLPNFSTSLSMTKIYQKFKSFVYQPCSVMLTLYKNKNQGLTMMSTSWR